MSKTPAPAFVDLASYEPSLLIDARYAGRHNFLGRPVEGYLAPLCLLSLSAAHALANANRLAGTFGLALKVFDAYRPQRAVDDFVRWTRDTEADPRVKAEYYPRIDKSDIVRLGYIAEKSSHSRASAVDVTLVRSARAEPGDLPPHRTPGARDAADFLLNGELDMGGAFDLFDAVSRMDNAESGADIMRRRRLLQAVMQSAGFVGIREEWWHFRLADEPFPDTYFDFPVAPKGWQR